MRVLRSCDFCEADATGTFEVLPPELNPTDDEQRRVLLCSACATRLEHLIAPLLERVSGDQMGLKSPSASSSSSQPSSSTPTESPSSSTPTESPSPSSAPTEPNPPAEPTTAGAGASDLNPIVLDSDSSQSTASDSPNVEAESPKTDSKPSHTEPTADRPDSASSDGTDDTETDDGDLDGKAHQTPQSGPPRAYGKAIRLLRNREFPMERSTVEVIVGGAYDLESHEVTELLEYAIEDGRLREEGSRLDWA